jgi:rod shape determining protein RodA
VSTLRSSLSRVFDPWLVVAVALLCLLSLVVIASATGQLQPHHPLYFVQHQLLWFALGTALAAVAMGVDHTRLKPYGNAIYAVGVVLLALVLVHGQTALGAQRWIPLGPFQLQPSEFAKVAVVFGLATMLEPHRGKLATWGDLLPPIVLTMVPALLVMLQPDLGTALVFIGILIAMLYMGGAPVGRLLLIFGGGFAAVVALIAAHLRYHVPLPVLHDYQLKRLLVFLNPNLDPLGAGYNMIQSEVTLAAGGVHGLGVFGHEAMLSFLPENYTDFIFSVVGMETGLVGGLAVLALYFIILYRILAVVRLAKDLYGALLATGLGAIIALHVLMNAGMAMGIMPVVGVPLPFVSYGGSSALTDFLAVGLVLSVRRSSMPISFAGASGSTFALR